MSGPDATHGQGDAARMVAVRRVRSAPVRALGPVLLALSVVLAVGCSPDPEPTVAPAPPAAAAADEPTTAPPEDPQDQAPPPPVRGIVELMEADLSPVASGLHPDGAGGDTPIPADRDAVDDAVAAATAWVDGHLTDLQEGGDGWLADTELTGEVAELAALTDPEHPVAAARYAVMVGVRGTPEWVQLQARVARDGADPTVATFVFVPDDRDGVRLLSAATGGVLSTAAEEGP
jgi:hypothetical protein